MHTMTYFDISGWIVLIKSEIFITMGMVWPISSNKIESALREEAFVGDCTVCNLNVPAGFFLCVLMSPNEPLLSTQSIIE